jgi:hypothetical protein
MRCECHAHVFMNGREYREAVELHKSGVNQPWVHSVLAAYQNAGIQYVRDGGDKYGVSAYAKSIALDYGITYVTPVYAIYKRGLYGGIVGRPYDDFQSYKRLVREAVAAGADFIKLMYSGILSFDVYGELSCPSLESREIRDLVGFAHDCGLRVMAHVNGADAVKGAILAGTDSIEHGYYMDAECLSMLAESQTVWTPTVAAVDAFKDRPGFDGAVVRRILALQRENIRQGLTQGIALATGSDAGAVGVPHGEGAQRERVLLNEIAEADLFDTLNRSLNVGNERIQKNFFPICNRESAR